MFLSLPVWVLDEIFESLLCGVYVGNRGCRPHRTVMERKKNESGQELPPQGGGCPRMTVLLCSFGEVLGAVLCIFPPGQSSVLKGVTIACSVSCHCRERKAPLTDLRTP